MEKTKFDEIEINDKKSFCNHFHKIKLIPV